MSTTHIREEIISLYQYACSLPFPKSIYLQHSRSNPIVLAFSYGCGSTSFWIQLEHLDEKRLRALKGSVAVLTENMDITDPEGQKYIELHLEVFRKIVMMCKETKGEQ